MKKINSCIIAVLSVIVLFVNSSIVNAYSVDISHKVAGTEYCTLTNLSKKLAVQNFYIADDYIYITQRSGSTTYISRCNSTGAYLDTMTLTNCGHGQTLEAFTYNSKDYLLVGCKSNSADDNYWSLQIGRIEYSANKTMDYSEIHRFSYMNYANGTGTSIGTTKRVAAAMSQGNDRMIFRVENTEGDVRYSVYYMNELNKLLDQNESVDMRSSAAKNACVFSFEQKKAVKVWPNESFQGIELTGVSTVYVSGGNEGETPKICRMTQKGDYVSEVTITNVGTKEIEGITVKSNGYLYYLIVNASNKQNGQKIYRISTSEFN